MAIISIYLIPEFNLGEIDAVLGSGVEGQGSNALEIEQGSSEMVWKLVSTTL